MYKTVNLFFGCYLVNKIDVFKLWANSGTKTFFWFFRRKKLIKFF